MPSIDMESCVSEPLTAKHDRLRAAPIRSAVSRSSPSMERSSAVTGAGWTAMYSAAAREMFDEVGVVELNDILQRTRF